MNTIEIPAISTSASVRFYFDEIDATDERKQQLAQRAIQPLQESLALELAANPLEPGSHLNGSAWLDWEGLEIGYRLYCCDDSAYGLYVVISAPSGYLLESSTFDAFINEQIAVRHENLKKAQW